MKKLLLTLCLGCTVTLSNAQDQINQHSLQDVHHKVLGYIKGGTITNADNVYLGEFRSGDGQYTILDKSHKILGYLVKGYEVQDIMRHTLGYIKNSAAGTYSFTITDANDHTLGFINAENGAVTNSLHEVIGYEIQTEAFWAAPYFFFFKFQ